MREKLFEMCDEWEDESVLFGQQWRQYEAAEVPGEYPVVLGGGLFSVYPEYVAALRQSCPAQARLISTDMPVVYGAAVEALAAVNMRIDAAFRSTFLSDYHALTAAARQGRAM